LGDNQPNTSAHAREILGADVELWPAIACSDISALQNVMTYMGQWSHDAVAIAVARGYHGYMVDIELVGVDPWSHAWCTSILVFLTQFANALREAGAICDHTFVVFFYGVFPGSFEDMKAMGLQLHHLCTWWDVLEVCKERPYFEESALKEVRKFLENPVAWSAARGGVASREEARAYKAAKG
jgi:hypothetical protein